VVEILDSIPANQRTFSLKITTHEDSTFTLSNFRQKKEKFSDEITGSYGKAINTPVGRLAIYPTKFMTNNEAITGGEPVPTEIAYSITPVKACAHNYCEQIQASYDEDKGSIVTLTIACTTDKKSRDVLEAVVNAYNRRWISDRNKISIATSKFIDDRLESIEAELGDVETNITDYKSQHRLMDLESVASVYLNQSTENQKALNELAQDMAIARSIKQELASNDITHLLPVTADIAGTNIQQLVTQYNTAVADLNLKLKSVPEDSPLLAPKTEAIQRTRAAILESIDAALSSLNQRYNSIKLIDSTTQSQLATAPGQAKYLMSEERKQKVKESLYIYLLQRREENELSQAFTAYNTRMVTEPYCSGVPSSPNTRNVLLVAFVMALLIPTALVYLLEVMNSKVRSLKDIENLTMPYAGEIPAIRSKHKISPKQLKKLSSTADNTAREILVRPHCGNSVNEAFRMIRTNIDFMNSMKATNDGQGKVIMTVSLNVGSGKTFVALNTAAMFAIKGKKVCLVDFDLRKGTLSHTVNDPRLGVTNYLIGNCDIDEIVVKNVNDIPGFDVIPEGTRPPNPTELLISGRTEEFLSELRARYDYVILDCPPVECVADSRIINDFVDMTLFVIRAGLFERTNLPVLQRFYDTQRYKNIVVVLNATDGVHGVYGRYGYGYGYGYKAKGAKESED
jgi:capsular exopolysaccharide synthesis family protein